MLRSLAVTPSSSRQGSLCTNASIWYFALMNSDLMGLHGTHRRQWEPSLGEPPYRPPSQKHGPAHHPAAPLTGLCLGGWLCAGHFAPAQGLAGSAPRWSWPRCWQACAPSVGKRCQARECPLRAGHQGRHSQSACCSWKYHQGAYCVPGVTGMCPVLSTSCRLTLVGLLRFREFKQLAQCTKRRVQANEQTLQGEGLSGTAGVTLL